MSEVDRGVASLEGLPRKNGELVFEAPWQGRAFGMAVALTRSRGFEWDDFRKLLIDEIERDPACEYYASWLRAFERYLRERYVVTQSEIDSRKAEYTSMEREGVF